MSQDNLSRRRVSEIDGQTARLERQMGEARIQSSDARTDLERRRSIERFRAIQRSSEDLRGELERMLMANNRPSTSTRDARSSLQGQPASSSRQRHPQVSSSSNTGSMLSPRRYQEERGTSHNPDIPPGMTLEGYLARQAHQRASRSQDLYPGTSSNYGQPTTYSPGTSSEQGFGQTTGTQTFPNHQPSAESQQNLMPRAPSWQPPQAQQQSYYQGYTTSAAAPSLTRTSGQPDSTNPTSSESSEDERVDSRGTPYRGSQRQLHNVAGSASARNNTDPAQRQRSHHRSASGTAASGPTGSPSQTTGIPSSSRHRRSSSNPSNTITRSDRPPLTGGPTLPSPAAGQPRQTAAPMSFQRFGQSSPLSQPSQQPAPEYRFPPSNSQSRPYAGNGQQGPPENRYLTGGAPPNVGAMTTQLQQRRFNQSNQQRAPVGSGSGIPMSGTSLGYPQQTHARRASSLNTNVNAYQNSTSRRISTPPLGANTMSSAPTFPLSYPSTSNARRGVSPSRLGPRGQLSGTQRQPGTLPPLGGPSPNVGPSVIPTGHARQPGGPRGRDPSPLRAGYYGTSSQGRNLTPPREIRRRRQ